MKVKPGATTRNARNRRSSRKRCPGCKQLRRKWFHPNHVPGRDGPRRIWGRLTDGGPLVCHICIERHGTDVSAD